MLCMVAMPNNSLIFGRIFWHFILEMPFSIKCHILEYIKGLLGEWNTLHRSDTKIADWSEELISPPPDKWLPFLEGTPS